MTAEARGVPGAILLAAAIVMATRSALSRRMLALLALPGLLFIQIVQATSPGTLPLTLTCWAAMLPAVAVVIVVLGYLRPWSDTSWPAGN